MLDIRRKYTVMLEKWLIYAICIVFEFRYSKRPSGRWYIFFFLFRF